MRGRSFWISLATRRMGAMDWREEGTTSLSKTSMEKVVVAALREGRRVREDGWPDGSFPTGNCDIFYFRSRALLSCN